ncbi:protein ALWAYS EARLY 3-like [Corylus avellana]|uniref:protein ALWAYS EARLY 3-like n=1 Tax=Corylus avellana TaxID=13451 RepID=UPI00286AAD5F|nr:protein ALWAYS EARLY 3-like [Corylus avellana]XP_059446410.1 protein ALWAYS EARLY 3-like [Corylus avellana]XP_059450915.1 protein ALWAYS EARLY 3-like [Corylus avellana]
MCSTRFTLELCPRWWKVHVILLWFLMGPHCPHLAAVFYAQKRKYSDKLGPQWSKEELEHFYQAYWKYGKDWKKVAAVVHNGSVEMVEALYITNWVGSVHYC